MNKHYDHPADLFVERYMPGANAEAREEARENVSRFVAVLVRINERLKHERPDSPESDSSGRVGESNTSTI